VKNKVLIIAGMHRSGTSLVTQWLNRCGLHVGDELLGKGIGNDDGHFEDMEFYTFHRRLLKSKNLPDSGFIEDETVCMTSKDRSSALNLIENKNKNSTEWGWKDPRTSLFLPDYHQLIPEANYLVVYRHFESTVGSLITRTQKVINAQAEKQHQRGFFAKLRHKPIQKKEIDELCQEYAPSFLKVWTHYNQQILDFLSTIPGEKFMVMNYEDLMKEDRQVWAHLRHQWQFNLDYTSFLNIYKPGLISKEIPFQRYVDRQLLDTAIALERRLADRSFSF
jgi:hypothetical protein